MLIGHEGHEEVEGTTGEAPDEHRPGADRRRRGRPRGRRSRPGRLHHPDDAVGRRDDWSSSPACARSSPNIVGPKSDDICYATTNRQIAVKQLARECDLVLVIGSTNSSNSNRLVEVAREHGAASHLIDNALQVDEEWLEGVETVGHHLRSERSRGAGRAARRRSSASAAPKTSPSCGRSTRTSASCSRRRSGPSWRLAAE